MSTQPDSVAPRRLRRGDSVDVTVDTLTHDGRGVARHAGKVIFVSDALPGETVTATVVRRRRNRDEARAAEVQVASPDRVEPRCEWFGVCGGCSLQHLATAAQLAAKEDWLFEALRRIGAGLPEQRLPAVAGPVWNYRRKARLGVRYVDGKGRVLVGFREKFKPYVTDMAGCEVLDARLAGLIAPLQDVIGQLDIRRRLPQIEVAAGESRVVLVMRVLDPPTAADRARLADFERAHAVDICLQHGGPDGVVTLTGDPVPALAYTLPGHDVAIEFQPTDFVQVNAAINRELVDRVVDWLQPEPTDRVLDLYCGLGNFSLPLARRAATVVGIEGAAGLVARARANAQRNRLANATFHAADLDGDLAAVAALQQTYDLMLIDPPRSGATAVCERAQHLGVRRIVYVSCHPATLARDAATLGAGGFKMIAAGVFDMFPHTAHVESLAVFDRQE